MKSATELCYIDTVILFLGHRDRLGNDREWGPVRYTAAADGANSVQSGVQTGWLLPVSDHKPDAVRWVSRGRKGFVSSELFEKISKLNSHSS